MPAIAAESSSVRPRPVLPALAWLLGAGFVIGFVAQYLWVTPERYHQFWPRRWWLFVHLAAGTVALLLAPVQYWLGATGRRRDLHRLAGRTYLVAILVSSIAAIGLALLNDVSWLYGVGLLCLAAAWLTTSGMAWLAIRRWQIEQHREWMIRSAVVTFGFVWFRAILGTTMALELGAEAERFAAAAWGCWSIPLLVTEVWLQRRKL